MEHGQYFAHNETENTMQLYQNIGNGWWKVNFRLGSFNPRFYHFHESYIQHFYHQVF